MASATVKASIPTDPGLLKIRHSHRFVAVFIQFFNSISYTAFKLDRDFLFVIEHV